jgi:hypothetical protein
MTVVETPPIACALAPGAFKDRLAWIRALAKDALRSHERRDLTLDLVYAPEARDRVREMVRNERACCPFLTFDLHEQPHEVRLTITAPEAARETADMLFEQFVAGSYEHSACGCGGASETALTAGAETLVGTRAAGIAAVTLATGAVACGACCVLPLALPAVVLAGTGTALAWLAAAHAWITPVAILVVASAWGWIGWLTVRTRRKPAPSTVYLMAAATMLAGIALSWPLIEPGFARMLRS